MNIFKFIYHMSQLERALSTADVCADQFKEERRTKLFSQQSTVEVNVDVNV